ncbi:hypothetical protein OGATHE_004907, partial [Ogataea polymorpha]
VQPQDRRPLPFLNIKPLSEPSRVVQQQDTASVVSSLNSQNQPPTPFLESKTLNRKNVKKLTLSAPQLTIRTNSTTSSLGNTSSMSPLDQAGFKDPDKKASTDELIANIQNLE